MANHYLVWTTNLSYTEASLITVACREIPDKTEPLHSRFIYCYTPLSSQGWLGTKWVCLLLGLSLPDGMVAPKIRM